VRPSTRRAGARLALATSLWLGLASGPGSRAEEARLVVHEWGTFTAVVGADGRPLAWRPLSGPPDLPCFVHSRREAGRPFGDARLVKARTEALVRMETPVVYFYADRDLTVDAEVAFPGGLVTEWYPQAAVSGAGIRWDDVQVEPGAAPLFASEPGPSHYYEARATDAAPLRVGRGREAPLERFLFYRGVGFVALPLEVRLEAGAVVLERRRGSSWGPEPSALIVESRGGLLGLAEARLLPGRVQARRPGLDASPTALRGALYDRLVATGLYPREADAMLETWRDQWLEDGLRVFYVLPESQLAALLPLRVRPRPTELRRVMLVRVEVITPEMEEGARERIRRMAGSPEGRRSAAEAIAASRGRFAGAVLRRLALQAADAASRARIQGVLAEAEEWVGRECPAPSP
jgi:hypothetical protein